MTFSIITIVYNDAAHILYTMQSVLNQTHKDTEYIIIDGASSDGTKEAILAYIKEHATITKESHQDSSLYIEATHTTHPSFTFKFLSQKDNGIFDAMNKGLRLATKEWVNFANCGDNLYDDSVLSNIASSYHAATLAKASTSTTQATTKASTTTQATTRAHQTPCAESTDYDIIYGDIQITYTDHNTRFIKKTSRDLGKLYKLFYDFGHPNCFIKTALHQKHPYDPRYKLAGDYDLIYKLYKTQHRFFFSDVIVSNFTSGGASDTNGYKSLKEALQIALHYNKTSPLTQLKILGFYLFGIAKKTLKLYFPKSLTTLLLRAFITPKS